MKYFAIAFLLLTNVFILNGQTCPSLFSKITLPLSDEGDRYGSKMASNKDFLVVSAPYKKYGDFVSLGAVIVYRKVEGNYIKTQELLPSIKVNSTLFGLSVSMSESQLVVSTNTKEVYVFVKNIEGYWVEKQVIVDPSAYVGSAQIAQDKMLINYYGNNSIIAYLEQVDGVWVRKGVVNNPSGTWGKGLIIDCLFSNGNIVVTTNNETYFCEYPLFY